jgi:hypothetical protein
MSNEILKPPANPQGKGLVPLISDWNAYQPTTIKDKTIEQLFAEYFTSLLVLFSDFRFRPVVGNIYYLYFNEHRWMLSMIEPERWDREKRGDYFGSCQLHEDMTWSINSSTSIEQHPDIEKALIMFYKSTLLSLDSDIPLRRKLPFYVDHLPYYRRMAATGLARSMSHSFEGFGLLQQPSKSLMLSLPQINKAFSLAPGNA